MEKRKQVVGRRSSAKNVKKAKMKTVILKNKKTGEEKRAITYPSIMGTTYLRSNRSDAIHFTKNFIKKHFDILPCNDDPVEVLKTLGD